MNLFDYERIAALIHWPRFDEEMQRIRQEKFDSCYAQKYTYYQSVKRSIQGLIDGHGDKAVRFDHAAGEQELEVAIADGQESMEVDHGESPVTFIRKQLEYAEFAPVPLKSIVQPNEEVIEEVHELQPTPSTNNRSVTFEIIEEEVLGESMPRQPTPSANRSNYEMTEEKVYLPSTEENYNVDDLSSNDETDDEENPRKTVPPWAKGVNMTVKVLASLVSQDQIQRHFGVIEGPSVENLFKDQKKHKRRVASSDEAMQWEPATK